MTTLDLSGLKNDGDTIDLEGGYQLRLKIRSDEYGIDDIGSFGDVYGSTQWTQNDAITGRSVRPAHFTGKAEILDRERSSCLWWEPNLDGIGPDFDMTQYRRCVRDIMEYGFNVYGIELLSGVDAYGRPIVVACEWIGGVEPFADDVCKANIVDTLVSMVQVQHGIPLP